MQTRKIQAVHETVLSIFAGMLSVAWHASYPPCNHAVRASLIPIRYGRWPHTTIDSGSIGPGCGELRLSDVLQSPATTHYSLSRL